MYIFKNPSANYILESQSEKLVSFLRMLKFNMIFEQVLEPMLAPLKGRRLNFEEKLERINTFVKILEQGLRANISYSELEVRVNDITK